MIVYSVKGVKDACIYSIEDERHRVQQLISTKTHTNKRCEILRTDLRHCYDTIKSTFIRITQ